MDSPSPSSTASHRLPRGKRLLQTKLGPDAHIVAWGKAWVSRDGRLPRLLAGRTLDFVVLTEHRLLLFSTGFFTRRPRRRVYDQRLSGIRIQDRKKRRGRALRVSRPDIETVPLLFEFTPNARNVPLASQLLQATRTDGAQ